MVIYYIVNESLHSNISRVVGCDPEFHWCKWMPQVNLVQYIVALICGAIGYPIATAYVSVLFTLVIGPRRQVRIRS